MKNPFKRCDKCVYYVLPSSEPMGECRRYPPQIITLKGQGEGLADMSRVLTFPEVQGDSWCGEFQPASPSN